MNDTQNKMPKTPSLTLERIEIVDFARGFSMSMVIFSHAFMQWSTAPILAALVSLGGAGVHLFIMLSGFTLANSRQVSAVDFFKRRFIKILIPYYICVTAIFILNAFFYLYADGMYSWLGHIFLFKMFDERIITSFGHHFWFVSTIIQLYAVYPLLAWCKEKYGIRALFIGSLALSVTWWIWLAYTGLHTQRIYGSFFLQYLWEFALGMVFAGAYQKGVQLWNASLVKIAIIGVIALGLYGVLSVSGTGLGKVFNDIPALVGYVCGCIVCFRLLSVFPAGKNAMNFIGRHSYVIYLWHGLVLRVLRGYY